MTPSHSSSSLVSRSMGTGPDLVFLHGWGMNSGAFSSFTPLLDHAYRITLIDLPGFGNNAAHVPSPYTLASLTDSVSALIPQGSVVAGWSLGGMVAQELVKTRQDIRALVTIASSPRFVAGQCWPGISPDLLAQFEDQLEHDYKKTIERFLAIQAMGSATARHDIKAIRTAIEGFPSPSPQALQAGLRILGQADQRDWVGRLSVPTLRIFGRLDSLVPTSAIDRMCELHPQADTVVLPHASHAPFISHPEQTASILDKFIAAL
ncbi:pimeloyl-ACP methyl ester esterase BioH [Alteromonas sp. CYL-A6]|uniref:pimeloyl-ACP methyl ester esterase BioH n=1 Tax=Alteromonas nitratireducens TaxID=3390813 RepID=UPI0034ABB426